MEDLVRAIGRAKRLIAQYESIGVDGVHGIWYIEEAIEEAENALTEKDVQEMKVICERLNKIKAPIMGTLSTLS